MSGERKFLRLLSHRDVLIFVALDIDHVDCKSIIDIERKSEIINRDMKRKGKIFKIFKINK